MRKVGRKIFMAKAKFFLDTRRTKPGAPSVLKVAISQRTKTAYLSLSARLFPNQWDDEHSMVVNHPEQQLLNLYIGGVMQKVDRTIYILADSGELPSMTANDIKLEIERRVDPVKAEEKTKAEQRKNLFAARFLNFAKSRPKESTKGVYMHTYKRMVAFEGESKLQKLAFEDITKEWIYKFEAFLAITSPSKNARNIHLRNIRAVFNEAIDDEITTFYPFRKLKIRPVATKKRNLKVEELRTLWNYPCEPHAQKYLDMFKLMFMLIGINSIDLAHLKEVCDGRVEFYRSKTNRLYSIKVEPEALVELPAGVISNVYYKSENTLPYKAHLDVAVENGLKFHVDWLRGQKTGFFVDQRENRALLERYSAGRRVLNMFCYTGGFSFYAMRGGAQLVHSVDSFGKAVSLTQRNVELNYPGDARHKAFAEDAFDYLDQIERDAYVLIILDPPAFAKHKSALKNALVGYRRLNAKAFTKIQSGGVLFTFSCSQAVSKEQFRLAVFSAAAQSRRKVRILHQLTQPADHPINIYHPEGE